MMGFLFEITCAIGRQEASCGDAAVCAQFDVKLIPSRVNGAGLLAATQSAQLWSTVAAAVVHLHTHTATDNLLHK